MQRHRSNSSTVMGLAALGLIGLSATAGANTITLDTPENFTNTEAGEAAALTSNTTGSIGSGSWQADPNLGSNEQHLIYLQGGAPGPYEGGPNSYPTERTNPNLLFPTGTDVQIEDLVSISYDTKTEGPNDWFVDIFTTQDGVDDGSFFGYNFDLTSGEAGNSEAPDGFTRNTLDSDSGMLFDDEDLRDGGSRTDYTLPQLKEEFGDESLLFIALGTATNYENFDGFVDNFQFSYTDSDGATISRQIDLEPQQQAVPVPAMWPLAAFGFAAVFGLAGYRRRDV